MPKKIELRHFKGEGALMSVIPWCGGQRSNDEVLQTLQYILKTDVLC